MARNLRLVTKLPPPAADYYVYDPGVLTDIGKVPVVETNEGKMIRLTRKQARYLLDQGAIGRKPLHELSDESRHIISQVTRGRVPPPPPSPPDEPLPMVDDWGMPPDESTLPLQQAATQPAASRRRLRTAASKLSE